MLRRLLDVRPEERRPTAIAFLVLFGILAAHTILETARDALGLGAVATTDVLALELDRETLVDIFEDFFPFLLEAIKDSSRRHLDFIRRMKQVPNQLPAIHPEPFLFDGLDFVERLLFLKAPGG